MALKVMRLILKWMRDQTGSHWRYITISCVHLDFGYRQYRMNSIQRPKGVTTMHAFRAREFRQHLYSLQLFDVIFVYTIRLHQNNLEAHARWAGWVETLHAQNHEWSARIIYQDLKYFKFNMSIGQVIGQLYQPSFEICMPRTSGSLFWCTLTIEKWVAVVNTASDYCVGHRYGVFPVKMFANVPKLVHVVVATLDNTILW